MFPIRRAEPLGPTITRFVIEAPLVARKWRAGQFVIVRVAEAGERIPLTVVETGPQGAITLIVQAVGKTTRQLCSLRAGDALLDVLGPLGQPTPVTRHGRVACVGGGVGAAELLPIARALGAAGNEIHAILGARTRELLILEAETGAASASLSVMTDDGSRGRRGLVTDRLRELVAQAPGIDAVYAIGPLPMMRAAAEVTKPLGVPTWVSLNPIMLDGTGMCGGCRVTVGGETRFACVDGPEFDGHQVDFAELMRRNASYRAYERAADERWRGGCAPGAEAAG
jgi:ferredoxin/flavodoxin---NADP+ reductase